MPYTLRTRTELCVTDPELLRVRARLTAARTGAPAPVSESDAVQVVVTDTDPADVAEDAAEYGLAVTGAVTVLSYHQAADDPAWTDHPFPDLDSGVLVHLIDDRTAPDTTSDESDSPHSPPARVAKRQPR